MATDHMKKTLADAYAANAEDVADTIYAAGRALAEAEALASVGGASSEKVKEWTAAREALEKLIK